MGGFGFGGSNGGVVGVDGVFGSEVGKFGVYGDGWDNDKVGVFVLRRFVEIKKKVECGFDK